MNSKHSQLYPLQDAVFQQLQRMDDPQFNASKFCGGTALSRCWMQHRTSFDLDFFMPEGFKAQTLLSSFKKHGIHYDIKDLVTDSHKANQLHGFVRLSGQWLKVSFVEDAYFDVFPKVQRPFGNLSVQTESIDGLYHRKLRTIAGSASDGDVVVGGRQKARDLFDLYVLSKKHKPLPSFIASLPYTFPVDAFISGLSAIPWIDVCQELDEIECDQKWVSGKDVGVLSGHLYSEMSITTPDVDYWEVEPVDFEPTPKQKVKP
jgi:Nucleotidyl transferase AbiEii toxin, Type IV TA system